MTFSERYGFKPVRSAIQVDSMDSALRTSLWNTFVGNFSSFDDGLMVDLWCDLIRLPIDEFPRLDFLEGKMLGEVKDHFFGCTWYEAYDFLEFVANSPHANEERLSSFLSGCNDVLKSEMSAYRFVGTRLAPLTSEQEITAIEEALTATEAASPLNLVNTHLKQALTLLADRTSPDYRNSMKESINAVECLCKLIAKKPDATLGPALDTIQKKKKLHPALVDAFKKLYGYTSDADGIRHALKDAPTVDVEDARYMLVMCAGFVSYLIEKAIKAGITF